jgi:hypothetical protein
MLSVRSTIFNDHWFCAKQFLAMTRSSLKKQNGEYQPNTNTKIDFLVQSPDRIALGKKFSQEYLTLGHL